MVPLAPSDEGGRILDRLLADPRRRGRVTHVETVPARQGRRVDWPEWVPRLLIDRLKLAGIDAPWEHQATAAEHARAGRSVIIATGTASGKSLAYLMPAIAAVLGERQTIGTQRARLAARTEIGVGSREDRWPAQGRIEEEPGDEPHDGWIVLRPGARLPGHRPKALPRPKHTPPIPPPRTNSDSATNPGAGTNHNPKPESSAGVGAEPGAGAGSGLGAAPGAGVGAGAEPGAGAGSGLGAEVGAGVGPGTGVGSRGTSFQGVDVRAGVRADVRAGVGSSAGVVEGDGTVLYLSPTKALAADQLRALRALRLAKLRAATYDGDTPPDERNWVRAYSNYVLTNPDMLHRSMLPSHARWAPFLRRLRYVVIDEAHGYRGVFGSHVAQILRRLRRICARYGANPVFILASATTAEPATTAARLTGLSVEEVADDASPRGAAAFVLWEPPLTELRGEHGAPTRRSATAETADLLADLVVEDVQTLAFVRSRKGAESVALSARRALTEVSPELTDQVAAYRAGYLPEERRELEAALRSRSIVGLASTNALELGVDVSGLDAVVVCGWPGTRASLWQQAGRAGRAGQGALAVLVARDDPLDTFLVHHPEAIFGTPVESTVLDPDNPYVLEPHLCAAAAEMPLTEADMELFGPVTADVVPDLVRRGMLRHRPTGWYWTKRERATDLADIRSVGGDPIQVVEAATGRLLGTVDEASAHTTVHEGAVYLHQGESYLVQTLDLEDSVALVEAAEPDYSTIARGVTEIRIVETLRTSAWGEATLCFGTVEVTRQVVAYQMRRLLTGQMLGEKPLDLPRRTLRTRAVWWTLSDGQRDSLGDLDLDVTGAAHAAEHASIGLLPLFATCDRWDIGGVSTSSHPDTGLLTVFVYDGHEGGAGFAERGYADAGEWLQATRDAIRACECEAGCPSCIQSPKCGNGNEPLDKQGALALLGELLRGGPKVTKP